MSDNVFHQKMKTVKSPMPEKTKKKIGILAGVIIVLLILIFTAITIVPTNYTGVRVKFGQVSSENVQSGIAFNIPFIEQIKLVNNRQQDIDIQGAISAETEERTEIFYDNISVTYRIESARSSWVVANVTNYEYGLINGNIVSSAIKAKAKSYDSTNATSRATIEPAFAESLQKYVDEKYGPDTVTIIKLTVGNADFDASYNEAIAKKQTAQINYQTQQIENQRQIELADTNAAVTKTNAKAEADANVIIAQGEADANAIRQASLSPIIIRYEIIKKWDGKLPLYQGGDNSILPVLDLTDEGQTTDAAPTPTPTPTPAPTPEPTPTPKAG